MLAQVPQVLLQPTRIPPSLETPTTVSTTAETARLPHMPLLSNSNSTMLKVISTVVFTNSKVSPNKPGSPPTRSSPLVTLVNRTAPLVSWDQLVPPDPLLNRLPDNTLMLPDSKA